jgi:hypothetical protein
MIKIEHVKEIGKLTNLPKEVIVAVEQILIVLDLEYGEDRNADDDGGYVVFVESKEDFEVIKDDLYLNLEEDAIPEFVDLIKCEIGECFTSTLILSNNDFGISFLIPLSITPENLKDYIIEN